MPDEPVVPPPSGPPDKSRFWLGRIGRWLFTGLAVAAVLLVLAASSFDTWLRDKAFGPSGGHIEFQTPQVYTRERLVNDRFKEQAWLEAQLDRITNEQDVLAASTEFIEVLRLNARAAGNGAAPDQTQAFSKILDGLVDKMKAVPESDRPKVLFSDSFRRLQNFRALVRRELIQNELDDRHDIGANTLSMFRFGVSLVPDSRTWRSALVEVAIEPQSRLRDLTDVFDSKAGACASLREFECAYLVSIERLNLSDVKLSTAQRQKFGFDDAFKEASSQSGAGPAEGTAGAPPKAASEAPEVAAERVAVDNMMAAYDGWNQLYADWLNAERQINAKIAKSYMDALKSDAARSGLDDVAEEIESRFIEMKQSAGLEGRRCGIMGQNESLLTALTKRLHACISESLPAIARQVEAMAEELGKQTQSAAEALAFRRIRAADTLLGRMLGKFGCLIQEPVGNYFRFDDAGVIAEAREQLSEAVAQCIVLSYINDVLLKRAQGDNYEFPLMQMSSRESRYAPGRNLKDFLKVEPNFKLDRSWPGTVSPFNLTFVALRKPSPACPNKPLGRSYQSVGDIDFKSKDVAGLLGIDNAVAVIGAGTPSQCRWDGEISVLAYMERPDLDFPFGGISTRFHAYLMTQASKLNAPFVAYSVPAGLFSFIQKMSRSQRSFGYSVYPENDYDVERAGSSRLTDLSLSGAGGAEAGAGYLSGGRDDRFLRPQKVIGFSSQDADAARFGWVLFAERAAAGSFGAGRMQPRSESLTAHVSLPAWWTSVKATVTGCWFDPSKIDPGAAGVSPSCAGARTADRALREFEIELPVRFDLIGDMLVGSRQRPPLIDDIQVEDVLMTACSPARVAIAGQRLWRSTIVTLGAQKANLIQVMPDMDGILAEYDSVEVPLSAEVRNAAMNPGRSVTYLEVPVTVTVWTSEGHAELKDKARIVVPGFAINNLRIGRPACETRSPAPAK